MAYVDIQKRCRELGFDSYNDYLQSKHWQQVKADWKRDPSRKHECYVCGSHRYQLHHRTYRNLGAEKPSDLIPLCQKHHSLVHSRVRSGWSKLSRGHVDAKRVYDKKSKKTVLKKKPKSLPDSQRFKGSATKLKNERSKRKIISKPLDDFCEEVLDRLPPPATS